MTYTKCPNCNKALTGFLSADLISQAQIDFMNTQLGRSEEGYCTSCAPPLYAGVAKKLEKQKGELEKRLQEIIYSIPIMTSPAPPKWDYEILGMVTAQTTAGTGFITELSRSFNDFFGSGSNTTNQKIAAATNSCKVDLRIQCVREGGNAVISTDIDFNEIGAGSTNMLMVCMAGTAIRVSDMAFFSENKRKLILEVIDLTEKLEAISKIPK